MTARVRRPLVANCLGRGIEGGFVVRKVVRSSERDAYEPAARRGAFSERSGG